LNTIKFEINNEIVNIEKEDFINNFKGHIINITCGNNKLQKQTIKPIDSIVDLMD